MRLIATILFFSICFFGTKLLAAPDFHQVLPGTTKGYVSFPNVDETRRLWKQTQIGQLVADPVMQPFVEGLRQQIRTKLIDNRFHLSIDFDELMDTCAGELCLATIHPEGEPEGHASVMLIDIGGNQEAARQLLQRTAEQLEEKGAERQVQQVADQELVVYQLPRRKGQIEIPYLVRVLTDEVLLLANHEKTCVDVLKRLKSAGDDSLANLPAFQQVMQRVAKDAGDLTPQVNWFFEPFGYAHVIRNARKTPRKRGSDMLNILETQGFDAVEGVGGRLHMATGKEDFLHRTFVYAPGASAPQDNFRLAARMLDFPNVEQWSMPDWVPRELATATQVSWRVPEAFEYSSTLVDAIAGDEHFFEDMLASIKEDPNGPQLDVRKEFVVHLGDRLTLISDHVFPITPRSERMLVAVAVTDEQAVRAAVHKVLDTDPNAVIHTVQGSTVWEMIDQEQTGPDLGLSEIDGVESFGAPLEDEEEAEPRLLRNSAITVHDGHFVIASHLDLVSRMLTPRDPENRLSKAKDFQWVNAQLQRIGGGGGTLRTFARTDEEYRPTYELIRQGKMPESESMLGKLLNRILGPEDEDILREQAIDGSKLPEFQAVRRYLGPAGGYMRAEADGWFASGLILDKQAQRIARQPDTGSAEVDQGATSSATAGAEN